MPQGLGAQRMSNPWAFAKKRGGLGRAFRGKLRIQRFWEKGQSPAGGRIWQVGVAFGAALPGGSEHMDDRWLLGVSAGCIG